MNRPNKLEGGNLNQYSLGNNQISLKFKKAFDILLTNQYYEGSKYGKYYYTYTVDNQNEIYVKQPKSEKIIDTIINSEDNIYFIVGYTGIGKTTLLRNYFKVCIDEIRKDNNQFICYYTFFEKVKLDTKLIDLVKGFINNIICNIIENDLIGYMNLYTDNFYESFYKFLNQIDENLINTFPTDKEYRDKVMNGNKYEIILDYFQKTKILEYKVYELIYFINKHDVIFKNIIFIFDDIESIPEQYHKNLFGIIDTIYDVMNKMYKIPKLRDRSSFKIIVALRNYSHRINNSRISETKRRDQIACTFVKKEVPELKKVIINRLKVVLKSPDLLRYIGNKPSFEESKDILLNILEKQYIKYDEMIRELSHNNIYNSMKLLIRIVTNKQFIGKYETSYQGAFDILYSTYKNMSSDDIFFALAYGENDYFDCCKDYYFCNLLHSHYCTMPNCELLELYIVRYLLNKYNFDQSIYGLKSEKGIEIKNKIRCLFENCDITNNLDKRLNYMLKYLYEGGVLLQSIYDKEPENYAGDRIYNEQYQLYLSLRGNKLNELLSENALLFEIYRDDIDTDYSDNIKKTLFLNNDEKIEFCIKYTSDLFEIEQKYIQSAITRIDKYIEYFGKDLLVSTLIKGIKQSIKAYYVNDSKEKEYLINQLNILINNINNYINQFNKSIESNNSLKFNVI